MIISPERLDPFADGKFHHSSFVFIFLPFPPPFHVVDFFMVSIGPFLPLNPSTEMQLLAPQTWFLPRGQSSGLEAFWSTLTFPLNSRRNLWRKICSFWHEKTLHPCVGPNDRCRAGSPFLRGGYWVSSDGGLFHLSKRGLQIDCFWVEGLIDPCGYQAGSSYKNHDLATGMLGFEHHIRGRFNCIHVCVCINTYTRHRCKAVYGSLNDKSQPNIYRHQPNDLFWLVVPDLMAV